jgi:stalled ribosome rescue protein Dom34
LTHPAFPFANRRNNEEHSYFREIIENVGDADEVVIFGPGEAKDLLVNAIKEHSSHFNSDLMAVLTADSMTENQKVAYVKSFFEAN